MKSSNLGKPQNSLNTNNIDKLKDQNIGKRKVFDMLYLYTWLFNPNLENSKESIKALYLSVFNMLKYDKQLIEFVKTNPLYVNNKNEIFYWLYSFSRYLNFNMPEYNDFYKKYINMEIEKTTWSHPTWFSIHYLAKLCNSLDLFKKDYKTFISSLQFSIPCQMCRDHLQKNLKYINIDKCSKLFNYSVDLHNIVNKQLGYPLLSYNDAYNLY